MNKHSARLSWGLVTISLLAGVAAAASPAVTLESLLGEMTDRDRLARFPRPAYLCKQFSSYDRASRTPDDPASWFANKDNGNFLRTETNAGRQEWVLMDAAGPGCISRIWSPDRRSRNGQEDATVRLYLDGSSEPAIEAHWLDLLSGKLFVKPPFAHVSQRAGVMFLPVAFAKGCKITLDRPPFYYIINYRAYEPGTDVETFSMERFKAAGATLESVGKALLEARDPGGSATASIEKTIAPGAEEAVELPAGPAAVRGLTVILDPRDEQALRSTVLKMQFDGEETVWCPWGDFFGCGVGYHPFHGWFRTVAADGTMSCRWVMPYEKSARLAVANLGGGEVKVKVSAACGPWTWDDRSMRFHGTWRQQYPLPTQPRCDWNYVTVAGRGVYVGDTLAIMNPVAKWWGEGDEKIFVDGEGFPSHFGTGTEDYYGYAWGGTSSGFFTHPFHAQPTAGQNATFGQNTESRTRVLDAIPFTRSLKLDMEVWHWADCSVAYAVATYWYALPGATSNCGPAPEEAARPVPQPPAAPPTAPAKKPPAKGGKAKDKPAPPAESFPGAVEFEDRQPSAKSEGLVLTLQAIPQHRWSGGKQWLVRTTAPGQFVEFKFPVAKDGPKQVILHGTKAKDYGQFRISVNGKPLDRTFDFYSPDVVRTGPVELGVHAPADGAVTIRLEVTGNNAAAEGAKTYAGLDCVVFQEP